MLAIYKMLLSQSLGSNLAHVGLLSSVASLKIASLLTDFRGKLKCQRGEMLPHKIIGTLFFYPYYYRCTITHVSLATFCRALAPVHNSSQILRVTFEGQSSVWRRRCCSVKILDCSQNNDKAMTESFGALVRLNWHNRMNNTSDLIARKIQFNSLT